MSNIDKAADLIWDRVEPELGHYQSAETLAQDLADAGLLAPDLPEPEHDEDGICFWGAATFSITAGQKDRPGFVAVQDSEPGGVLYMDPAYSRDLAYALLAAADHAEKEAQK